MEEKKMFEKPQLTIVLFADEDIIVTSDGEGQLCSGEPGDDWCIGW